MTSFLEYARRGRNAWWRYLLAILLALVLWIGAQAVVVLPLAIAGKIPPQLASLMIDAGHPAYFYGATGAVFGALVLAFVAALGLVHGKRFGDIIGAWRWRQTAFGAAIWLALCAGAALVDYALEPSGFRLTAGPALLPLALWAVPSLAVQTFAEEFIFRGYLTQGLLLALRRPLPTALVSGAIFALMHIPNGWPQAGEALMFGIVAALIAMRTGGLSLTWGLHLANNLFGALVVVSTSDVLRGSPGVFTQATPNLAWVDGIATAILLAALWWMVGRRPAEASPRPS
jgi:membrane protease YdiL (CAAX protease family)